MRRLASIAALAVLGAALLVSSALGAIETGGKVGSKDYNRQVTKIGGSSPTDSIVYGVKVTSTGALSTEDSDRDRDFVVAPTELMNTTIAAGTMKGSNVINVSSYGRLALNLRWTFAAAADSDSVNIVVKVYAKNGSTLEDGVNHLWAPGDTSTIYRTSGGTSRVIATYYITRNTVAGMRIESSTQSYVYAIPYRMWHWAGNGGINLPLADNGIRFNAQYMTIEVVNASNTKALDTFVAEVWPRVN